MKNGHRRAGRPSRLRPDSSGHATPQTASNNTMPSSIQTFNAPTLDLSGSSVSVRCTNAAGENDSVELSSNSKTAGSQISARTRGCSDMHGRRLVELRERIHILTKDIRGVLATDWQESPVRILYDLV